MAAIDKLLYVLYENRMNVLELEPAHTPLLRKDADVWAVSKSTLSDKEIVRLLSQIVPKNQTFPPPPPQNDVAFQYELDGMVFQFKARRQQAGWWAAATVLGRTRDLADAAWEAAQVEREQRARPLPAISKLLRQITEAHASDLHLSSGQPPRMRLHGELKLIEQYCSPSAAELLELLQEITPERNRKELAERWDTDFAYEIPGAARYRVNLFRDQHGVGAVLRTIPHAIPAAQDIGLGPELCALAQLSRGLVLVTGPTGSGKSTTLASLVDLCNRTRNDHIVTIEDPIEFVHKSRRCLVHQREVGVHTHSFKAALRAALREDPDIVLVGEMRDLETISIALETAETGHLVFGTLHTTTAIGTIDRIIDQFPSAQQEQVRAMLSDTLKAVICQTLLPRLGAGRVAAREVMMVNQPIAHLIREGKTHQLLSTMQTGKAAHQKLMNESLIDLVTRGIVDAREAYLKTSERVDMVRRLQGANIDCSFIEQLGDDRPETLEAGGIAAAPRPAAAPRGDGAAVMGAGKTGGNGAARVPVELVAVS
ncbi:MAG TPA: type IV pilus twitching motility protein PilT [Thermoanaerobaculia bacterium]|nr:type IV pilus twitching motility protein PilT [Thermoanaerobaculia bacterium]